MTPSFNGATGGDGVSGVCSSKEFALQTNLQKLARRTNYVLSKQAELLDIKTKQKKTAAKRQRRKFVEAEIDRYQRCLWLDCEGYHGDNLADFQAQTDIDLPRTKFSSSERIF